MAKLVLGLGVSHTPQMSLPSDHWEEYAKNDGRFFDLLCRGQVWAFDDLVAERKSEDLGEQIDPELWRKRYDEITNAVSAAEDALEEADPDVLIVVGEDHHEIYSQAAMPTFSIYWGEEVEAIPPEEVYEAVKPAAWALFGNERETYPCHPGLGRYLISKLHELEFDVAQVSELPHETSVGHPFIAVRQRLMGKRPNLIPVVPVILNTYFPPNVPSPKRAWDFGRALASAVESYPEDITVAIAGSGGLSHFVVDFEFDKRFIEAIGNGDITGLRPEEFVSGTSECLCWLVAAGACSQMEMQVLGLIPGYRTLAGTGCTMGAAVWR